MSYNGMLFLHCILQITIRIAESIQTPGTRTVYQPSPIDTQPQRQQQFIFRTIIPTIRTVYSVVMTYLENATISNLVYSFLDSTLSTRHVTWTPFANDRSACEIHVEIFDTYTSHFYLELDGTTTNRHTNHRLSST